MAKKIYIKPRKISFAKQAIILKKEYPQSECYLGCGRLVWKGRIQPTPLSNTYKIRIECKDYNRRPKVILYGDSVKGIERSDFPHHFEIDKVKQEVVLCLHMPYEFSYSCVIADTIIPWTQEWLFYYEIWLAIGEWCGGGYNPQQGRT